MVLPAETIITEGIEIRVIKLPSNTRTPTIYTITAEGGGTPIAASSATIELSTDADVYLEEGLSLSFGATEVVLAESKALTAAGGATEVAVEPTTAEIADQAEATTDASLQLLGVTTASPSFSSTVIDVTNFKSGFGQENQVTGINRTFSIGGNNILANRALDTQVKPFATDDSQARGELWAKIIIPNSTARSEIYAGAAKVSNYNETLELRNVQKFTFELTMQGASFSWTPATAYT